MLHNMIKAVSTIHRKHKRGAGGGYRFALPFERDTCEHEFPFSLRRTTGYVLLTQNAGDSDPHRKRMKNKTTLQVVVVFIWCPGVDSNHRP
jgi:hypothetical protein